jgi:hypothetical protein
MNLKSSIGAGACLVLAGTGLGLFLAGLLPVQNSLSNNANAIATANAGTGATGEAAPIPKAGPVIAPPIMQAKEATDSQNAGENSNSNGTLKPNPSPEVVAHAADCAPSFTPTAVADWQRDWNEKTAEFIHKNAAIWTAGAGGENSDRLERGILSLAAGRYALSVSVFATAQIEVSGSLDMTDAAKEGGRNRLVIKQKESSAPDAAAKSFATDLIAPRDFGTDRDNRAVHVIWPSTNPQDWPGYSHLSFSVPAQMQAGEEAHRALYGLFEDFTWKPIGEVKLTKRRSERHKKKN